jgi:hypothetical protein
MLRKGDKVSIDLEKFKSDGENRPSESFYKNVEIVCKHSGKGEVLKPSKRNFDLTQVFFPLSRDIETDLWDAEYQYNMPVDKRGKGVRLFIRDKFLRFKKEILVYRRDK